MKYRCSICDFCLFCFFKNQQLDNALTEGEGVSVAEGEGRVRQSGRLSGVWTCLAACTKQRKYREMCRFSSYRRSHAALNSHLHLIHAFVLLLYLLLRADVRLKRGSSRRTNTGLGGVTPCTQLSLPLLLLAATFILEMISLIMISIRMCPTL